MLHGCLLQWPATVCLLFSLIWMGHQFTKEHCIDSLDSLPQWVFRAFRESEGEGKVQLSGIAQLWVEECAYPRDPEMFQLQIKLWQGWRNEWIWTIQQSLIFFIIVIIGPFWHDYDFIFSLQIIYIFTVFVLYLLLFNINSFFIILCYFLSPLMRYPQTDIKYTTKNPNHNQQSMLTFCKNIIPITKR